MNNGAASRPLIGCFVLFVLTTVPLAGQPSSDAIPTSPAGASSPQGIDVSAYSGTVGWPTVVEAGHTFAFAKATEGEDLLDPAFHQNWQQMKAAGVIRGAYHFYVTEDDPTAQAQFFLANLTLEAGDLAPVVDVEVIGNGTQAGLAARLRTFLSLVESAAGVKPIIYTTANFWDTNVGSGFGDYPLWVAEYEVEQPRVPQGWSTWHLWQWQENATVPGVQKGADLSKLNPAAPDLATLRVPARASSAATP